MNVLFSSSSFFLYSQKFSFKIKSPTVGKAKRKKESEVLNVLEVRK
jgi:hypothetical protein